MYTHMYNMYSIFYNVYIRLHQYEYLQDTESEAVSAASVLMWLGPAANFNQGEMTQVPTSKVKRIETTIHLDEVL